MKFLFALLQLFLIFHVVLNQNILYQNQSLMSLNVLYKLTLHEDGNLVLRSTPARDTPNKSEHLWDIALRDKNAGPFFMVMQEDGNLVIYDRHNNARWSTSTHGKGKGPYQCVLQDDGVFVVLDVEGKATWDSRSAGLKRTN